MKKKPAKGEAERALAGVIDGKLWTEFQGRPVVLHHLSAGEANRLTAIYQREVARLTREGELLSEGLIDAVVAKRAAEAGLDPQATNPDVQAAMLRRVYEAIPQAFREGGDGAIAENAQRLGEAFSPEDVRLLQAIGSVNRMKAQLADATVETAARALELQHELWTAARDPAPDSEGAPFWPSVEAMLAEPDAAFRKVLKEYQAFKAGLEPDFFSPSPGAAPGRPAGA